MSSTKLFSKPQNVVLFSINGVQRAVGQEITGGTTLNEFIREHTDLRGTKSMCLEGGCGACLVTATIEGKSMAVNSCLVPVMNCNGWAIETIEGIGNRHAGYHPVQARLAEMNGTQCGYCSPGMVMNMYSLTKGEKMTMKEIENSFGGNICRCTGYRPILDAFKTFASDADPKLTEKLRDIEELYDVRTCPRTGADCTGSCPKKPIEVENDSKCLHVGMEDSDFYKVRTIEQLFAIFTERADHDYLLNGGNTAHGVYRVTKPEVYIDLNDIPDLRRVEITNDCLVFGANVTMTTAMKSFLKYSCNTGFEHLKELANHVDLVANVPVRNMGTLAGNLMIKHQHREFPSDIFLIFETAGAQLHILESPSDKKTVSLWEFLEMDVRHKLIYSIILPAKSADYVYRSYKIMSRAQNVHAHVNAGFLFRLDGSGTVLEKPNIIIGGISKEFLHATKTEEYLVDKKILDTDVLQEALLTLKGELHPVDELPEYSPAFRSLLAQGLFYKFVLSIKPDRVATKFQSGGKLLERGLSSGKQDYDTDKNLWPLNQPVPKLEAIAQTAGEAQYANDLKKITGELFCAFVLTEVPNGKISGIDTTAALAMPGVVAFYSANDIPGKNLFISAEAKEGFLFHDETLFVGESILYAGQPIGIVVATSNAIARDAVHKVKVIYTDALVTKPVITIQDAIASGDQSRISTVVDVKATSRGNDVKHTITGEFEAGSQYHFTMELQSCVCVPTEDGVMDVYPSTQSLDITQVAIATCLGVPNNSINVRMKRIGGAYGAKISRASQIAAACALACYKLDRPVRFVMQMESNMLAIGKRPAVRQEYEVGVDDNGKIQYMNTTIWANSGCTFNEPLGLSTAGHYSNCYDPSSWTYQMRDVRTDLASNTWCRAPGSTDGVAMIENLLEHVARAIRKDPWEVRLANLDPNDGMFLQDLVKELKESADYETRRLSIVTFNEENRWKKKGISLVPMKYPLHYFGQQNAMVSIFARDGTVSISHGGTECGQGINTKVAQVAAYTLGIDLNMVAIKQNDNLISPNNFMTGGSSTSEACASATAAACKILLKRLEPIKAKLNNPTWKELTMAAYEANVDLCARHMFTAADVTSYNIWGASIAEVEVDILTGQHVVTRVDLIEDTGISMSPEVDLGQIEGAYVMGMGYWTCEDLRYDPETGLLTNTRSWNYHPPGAKDIPVDFRVAFRRNAPNAAGVLRSKATGEPPMCMSYGVLLAIRNALYSARADAGNTDIWFNLHAPATTEKILLASMTDRTQMRL